jgi:hypothetical protein
MERIVPRLHGIFGAALLPGRLQGYALEGVPSRVRGMMQATVALYILQSMKRFRGFPGITVGVAEYTEHLTQFLSFKGRTG